MSRYFKIGRLAATHGFQGEMVLQHSLGKKSTLKGLEKLFIEKEKDIFLPYFIRNTTARNETETLILLEGYESKEACKEIIRSEVWLTEEDFEKFTSRSAPISWLGFSMHDENGAIGEITEVIEQPHQILCMVNYKGKEALIPVHENSLLKVDKKNKIILVTLPEGLLDIYNP